MENQRQKDDVATPRGSTTANENNGLECQTGTTALTEPKGQFGEVANRLRYWRWRLRGFLYLLATNVAQLRRAWRDRWYISQAWSHAMPAEDWRGFYEDGYSPREALDEDASYG